MAKKKAVKELDLADILAGELNKQSKDSKVAFFLNDDDNQLSKKFFIKKENDIQVSLFLT